MCHLGTKIAKYDHFVFMYEQQYVKLNSLNINSTLCYNKNGPMSKLFSCRSCWLYKINAKATSVTEFYFIYYVLQLHFKNVLRFLLFIC